MFDGIGYNSFSFGKLMFSYLLSLVLLNTDLGLGPPLSWPIKSPNHSYEQLDDFGTETGSEGGLARNGVGEFSLLSCTDSYSKKKDSNRYRVLDKKLKDAPWLPAVFEKFRVTDRVFCIASEPATHSLLEMRKKSSGVWPLEFVASVGIQLIDIHMDMRFKHKTAAMYSAALKLPDLD